MVAEKVPEQEEGIRACPAALSLAMHRIMWRIMERWTKARCERVRFSRSLAGSAAATDPSKSPLGSSTTLSCVGALDDPELQARCLPAGAAVAR